MKNPAVLFYTADFITGTLFMSNEEVGAYIRLLCMQHQKGHLTEAEVKQICKTDDVYKSIIQNFKTDTDGLFYNQRMDLEKDKRSKYSESRANNRKKKEETYEKDMKNICNSYEKHMENENENINIYINNNKNNKYFNNKELNNIFKEYLKIRTKLKAVNSERAINSLLKKLEPFDDDTKYKMIEQSIINSWKSIYDLKTEFKSNKKVKPVPDWFDKEIKKEEVSDEVERLYKEIREYHTK